MSTRFCQVCHPPCSGRKINTPSLRANAKQPSCWCKKERSGNTALFFVQLAGLLRSSLAMTVNGINAPKLQSDFISSPHPEQHRFSDACRRILRKMIHSGSTRAFSAAHHEGLIFSKPRPHRALLHTASSRIRRSRRLYRHRQPWLGAHVGGSF